MKRAAVGPLPGVTQDIAGFKVCCCSFFAYSLYLFSLVAKLSAFFTIARVCVNA